MIRSLLHRGLKNWKWAAVMLLLAILVRDGASAQTVRPGELWLDDRGKHVQAHGGGVTRVGDHWYWFGEVEGPWSAFQDIAPVESKTYGAQSTMMFKVVENRQTTGVFMGDLWRPRTQWDSRYLWMPLEIGQGRLLLPAPNPWKLDVSTGEVEVEH